MCVCVFLCVSAVMNGRVLQDISGPAAAMMAEQTVLMKTDCEAEVQQQQRLEAIFHLSITLLGRTLRFLLCLPVVSQPPE